MITTYKQSNKTDDEKQENSNINTDKVNIFKKTIKNKIYDKMLNKETDKHYYYLDKQNNEREFLEVNGIKQFYYFRCTI